MRNFKKISILLILALLVGVFQVGPLSANGNLGIEKAFAAGDKFVSASLYDVYDYENNRENLKSERININGKYFYVKPVGESSNLKLYCASSETDKGTVIYKGQINDAIVTNGKVLYLTVNKFKRTKDYGDWYSCVYKINTNGKGKKLIKKFKVNSAGGGVVGLVDNKLTIKAYNPVRVLMDIYSLNLKTKKVKKVASNGGLHRLTSFVVGENFLFSAKKHSSENVKLKAYNMRTGKITTLINKGYIFDSAQDSQGNYYLLNRKEFYYSELNPAVDYELYSIGTSDKLVEKLDEFSASNALTWGLHDGNEQREIVLIKADYKGKDKVTDTNIYDWNVYLRDIDKKEETPIFSEKEAEDIRIQYYLDSRLLYYFGIKPSSVYEYSPDYVDENGDKYDGYRINLFNIAMYKLNLNDMKKDLVLELKDIDSPCFDSGGYYMEYWMGDNAPKIDSTFLLYKELKPSGKNTIETYKAVNIKDISQVFSREELYEAYDPEAASNEE